MTDNHSNDIKETFAPYETREKNAQQLKDIIESINSGVSVVVYGDGGKISLAYANGRYYELFGYTREQFVSELKAPHDVIFPEEAEDVTSAITNVKKTGLSSVFRYRARRRDGETVYISCNASMAAIDGLGDRVLLSVLTDVTASVKTEQQAIIFGQRLNAIMNNINSGVAASIINEDGSVDYVFVTDRYYEMLGYTREQYHDEVSDPFELIHSEDAESVRVEAASLKTVGESAKLRYRATRRDKRMIWLEANITIMTFADVDRPVQLTVFKDITHIVETNERLIAQQHQISEILNTTPGGIAIIEVDPDDITDSLHTVYYNDSFFSYSGYTRQEYDKLLRGNEMHFVFDEDAPLLFQATKKMCEGELGASADATVRCHTKDGGYRWLLLTGQLTARRGDICVINIVMVDVTKRMEALDRQRINEEMLRVAAETDKRAIITYDVKANECHVESRNLYSAKHGETLENIPDTLINLGIVAPDSVDELCSLFTRIRAGERNICVSLRLRTGSAEYQWFECNAAVIFDADGGPDHAVLVFHNITEQRIKEAVFKKWQQSIDKKPLASYTLFRCNLSKDSKLDEQEGKLLRIQYGPETASFNARTKAYAEKYVYPDDQERYTALLDSDALLAMFYRGDHAAEFEYREVDDHGELLWRRLTIEMVEYLNSTDVQAFLLYEDIDEQKKAELKEKELAEKDPLTGALNRVAFSEKVDGLIACEAGAQHALMMLDMDGFKLLNDHFGHAAGDQALMDIAAVLRSISREGDLVCRLGGDEFLVWLRDIPYDAVISKLAQQMCEQVSKAFSAEVRISASIGVAIFPRDGGNFDELYKNADKALYKVKQNGKNNFAFFSANGSEKESEIRLAMPLPNARSESAPKPLRRMLIVDDNATERVFLSGIFKDEYLIETAKNGAEAMVRLRHFGAAISVVLLDLMMPDIDGFEVLRRMQSNVELRAIPAIMVSADDGRNTLLKAVEAGAADYIAKPVDVELIRIRVRSAVSKADNERLRAQNSYLQLQRDEELKYRTVLESTGTVVVGYDWRNHVFTYDNTITNYLAGNYNHRGLWAVFLSDMVADCADVQTMQELMLNLANDSGMNKASKLVMLKTPAKAKHWFRVNIYKQSDAYGLAEKMTITFNDVHDEVLANEKLLFQATRDELTGLYNRAGFIQKAAEMIAVREPGYYVMACVDIEKFKVINDQYGTAKGDEVLRGFARVLSTTNGGVDCACCRVMADNFAVLYPRRLIGTPELTMAHREAQTQNGSMQPLKICIGRCIVDDKQLDISAIYDRASIAKETVKGRYDDFICTYDESMRTAILRQQEITGQMNQALADGQFEVWLQPQFNHANGMLAGAEALVRWRHPKEGLISPAEFIPIFERNGFVYEVDKYVWEQTCMLLRKWLDQGYKPVPVSVNISRCDVFRKDIVDVIKALVDKYSLPASLLRLEITESAFSESADQIIDVVERLVGFGFVVEIDDFGSGYSSLNTLKDVPAQVLKMDMRFLENDNNAQRGGSIIESVVRMAKWLGMSVIAEGVETFEQANYLRSIGCEYVQGYLYSRPTQITEYEKMFAEGKTESNLGKLNTVETWNNNAFWNPKSMETLIFNSYVGGACIFEYHNGGAELLRYNNAYAAIFKDKFAYSNVHQNLFEILSETNGRLFRDTIDRAVNLSQEAGCELALLEKDGGKLNVRITLRQIASTGDRSLFYCVVADVTSQRAAEEKERAASERVKAVMAYSRCGITAVTVDENMRVEYISANDRYYELLGYTREQFAAEVNDPFGCILPEDRDEVERQINSLTQIGQTVSVQMRARRRDGRVIWLHDDVTLVRFADVAAPVQLSNFMDITDQVEASELRLLAEHKESESAKKLAMIMGNVQGGITAAVLHEDGEVEIIFSNDGFAKLYGFTSEQLAAEVNDVQDLILPEDRARVMEAVARVIRERTPETIEYRCRTREGKIVWTQCHSSVVSLDGIDDNVLLAVTNDITAEKEVNLQLKYINDSAHGILAQQDCEKAICETLRRLMEYHNADRGYVVEFDHASKLSYNTYELCAEGVQSERDKLQGVPFSESDFWYEALSTDRFFCVEDVYTLEEGQTELRELLISQRINSMILAPLWRDGALIGFAGVDNPRSAKGPSRQLSAMGDYIAILLTRRDLNREAEHSSAVMNQLINDLPGGFCRIAVKSGQRPTLVTMNDGFCRMLDMTREEIMTEYGNDVYECFASEDVAASIFNARDARARGEQYSAECRLRRKNGKYLHARAFGRFADDEAGNTYLNVYFTDISAHRAARDIRIDLLDNIACGVALYEYDGERISVIHINKNYWKLVGREPVDYTKASVLDVVHPDDKPVIKREVDSCIRQHRDFAVDARVMSGSGIYTPFHITASVEPEEGGKYLFYATYTPISERVMSFQEMLPIALSTVMSSDEDIAFLKDADGRYITCSRSAISVFGLHDEADIVGKTSEEIFGGDVARVIMREDETVSATGKAMADRILKLPDAKGNTVILSMSKYPLLDGANNVIGIYTVCHDVTLQKNTEFELKTLLRVIPSGVLKYSADDKEEFAYVNHTFTQRLGYTEEQFRAKFNNCFRNMIYHEDMERVEQAISEQEENGGIGKFDFRIEAADGQLRWFHDEGVKVTDVDGKTWYYVTLADITERKLTEEKLRHAEEEYRLASSHSKATICRYSIADRTITITAEAAKRLDLPERIEDVPYGRVKTGRISSDTAQAYIDFYEDIMHGKKESMATFKKLLPNGWRWLNAHATTLFSADGKPISAVISYVDVTDRQEKEAVYRRWQQRLLDKGADAYTLYRCNLNKDCSYDIAEGTLIAFVASNDESLSFNDRTRAFAKQLVDAQDREKYINFVDANRMLANYHRGKRSEELEFRGKIASGETHWLRLSVELVEYPNSTEVEAYLMYEDINDKRLMELQTKKEAETDPLTGLLNRNAFMEGLNRLIAARRKKSYIALFMLDMDGFKHVNDSYGHAAGDRVLISAANAIRSVLREEDLVCRIGGDEFMVAIANMKDRASALAKAKLLCSLAHGIDSNAAGISISLGIAMCPDDGTDFTVLYDRADKALYYVKRHGKDNCAFYNEDMSAAPGEHGADNKKE